MIFKKRCANALLLEHVCMLNHVQLYATSMDCSPPGSSSQAAKEIIFLKNRCLACKKKSKSCRRGGLLAICSQQHQKWIQSLVLIQINPGTEMGEIDTKIICLEVKLEPWGESSPPDTLGKCIWIKSEKAKANNLA